MLAPVPVVTLDAPGESMVGEQFSFTATFDNQGTGPSSTGFGPYIDLFIDTTGADGVSPGTPAANAYDGLSGLSFEYLGTPLTGTPVTLGPGGSYTHPIARDASGNPVTGTAPAGFVAGDTLYVVALPFGSFVETQTPAEVTVRATVSVNADLNAPLNIAGQGGFQYGADALNNPTTDPSVLGASVATSVDPVVIRLFKEYQGPEDETATGPNFSRRYTIRADIANGQTIDDLRLIDLLPNDLAFLQVSSVTAGGTIEQAPPVGVASNAPNNELIAYFSSITGGPGDADAVLEWDFFVPEFDASGARILNAATGNDQSTINDGRASGSWDPQDSRDATDVFQIIDQSSNDDNHTLQQKSIAIQKSVSLLNDIGVTGYSPGDTLLYTLSFQISDYFTFGDLVIDDFLSDGQRVEGSPGGPFPGPFTLSVTDRNGTVSGNFSPSLSPGSTNLWIDLSQIGNDTNPATDGSTHLQFDVSRAMVDLGAADGILQGGRAILPNAGGAVGTITYRAVIQQQFSDDYPSGESAVDQGDQLGNTVTITGSVRDNGAIGSITDTETDGSGTQIEIVTGGLLKTIYALNGTLGPNDPSTDSDSNLVVGPSYTSGVRVRPGDTVTYRLRFHLPTADIENFIITDFLPFPVYDAGTLSATLDTTIDAAAPAAGTIKYGPDHTFSVMVPGGPATQDPVITINAGQNSVAFDLGDFDDPPPESPKVVDLLLSVQITDAPMADGLLLTNQVVAQHGTTNAGTLEEASIIQVELSQPDVQIRKGAVSSSNPATLYSSTVAPSGIVFESPGASTPGSVFTGGTISSSNLGTTLNANPRQVDAGDVVKFVIALENTGSSSAGAFDVRIRDSLPSGFVIPGAGLNLEVFDGTGAAVPFSVLGSGLFDPAGGIELDDPGATPATSSGSPPVTINGGSLDAFDASSGRNIVLVTYDLQVADNVSPNQTANLLNTATLFNFAGQESGDDHTTTDRTDTAQTRITQTVASKSRIGTSQNDASNDDSEVVIGELVTYQIQVTVPEGEMNNASIVDTLPAGMAFVDILSVTSSPALSLQNPIGTGTAPANVNITNSGQTITLQPGNIVNANRDNSVAETITIQYRAVVLNVASNQSSPAQTLTNSVRVFWQGSSTTAVSAPAVTVIEPQLTVQKLASPTSADANDVITYTVTLAHAGASNAIAYDVALVDVVPAGMNYVPGSWTQTGGLPADSTSVLGSTLSAAWNAFPLASTATFQFQTTLSSSVQGGSTVTNTAAADWTSLPGTTPADISSYNANSRERTGSGGVNDYTQSGSANVTVDVPATKTLVGTSEISTLGANLAVGEIARFRVAVQVPEGVSPAFQVIDVLPPGLQFLDDGTARAALVSNGAGLTSSTLNATFAVNGNSSAIPPSEALPGSAITGGPFGSGSPVSFELGTLTNSDNDVDGEFVVIEFNALVANVSGNQEGTTLANTALVRIDGTLVGTPTPAVILNVVEPSITNVVKSRTAPAAGVDAGATVTYSVTFSNPAGPNRSSAFDVRVADILPSTLQSLSNVRVFRNSVLQGSGFTNASSASTLDVTIDQVGVGDAIEIRYDAVVGTAVAPGASINNQANVTYTSLPGSQGTVSNPTGSTSGTASSSSGERTGAGGVNDYADNDTETTTIASHAISGFVYHDRNNNGLRDDALPHGIANVSIRLTGTNHLGNPVDQTVTTAADGSYAFTGLRPGTYSVTETQPSGWYSGRDTVGAPAFGVSNTDVFDNQLSTYTIATGTASSSSTENNFGELAPGIISGSVYIDLDNNGQRSGETGVSNIPIQLAGTDYLGQPVSLNTVTLADGSYQFSNLPPGTYSVTELSQPAGLLDGRDARGATVLAGSHATDQITGITLASGQSATGNDFGELPPATLSGEVFSDLSNNGIRDGQDTGISGVTIQITGTDVFNRAVSRTMSTDGTGAYSFEQLYPGSYTVTEMVQPSGYFDGLDSRESVVLNGTIGSDTISGIVLGVGGLSTQNNFAEVPEVGPTGYVYVDANLNGIRDAGEVGIPGVPITLTAVGNDVFGNPVPAQTAFTDATGFYEFVGLPPARYTVTETQPIGFQDGQEQNGTPPAASVLNDQFVDIDLTGAIVGGLYNFGEISPTGSLTGSVYVDSNNNGRRDPGELGLGGVTITLTSVNNQGPPVQVVTDAQGNYRFVKMFPGQYRLVQTQPVNFINGATAAGTLGGAASPNVVANITVGVNQTGVNYLFGEAGINPALISKRAFLTSANPATDFTAPAGSGVASVSVPLADPSGFVYEDLNGNGQRDEGEPGIAGVEITLQGTSFAGVEMHGVLQTDASGFYQFAFLPPGIYAVYQTQPGGFRDGAESLGSLGGVVGQDQFTQIVLYENQLGENYNFGEIRLPSEPGDANHDGRFDSSDLLQVFRAGEYEDDIDGNSTFEEGDWDGDGDFTSSDLIFALRDGQYVAAAISAALEDLFRR